MRVRLRGGVEVRLGERWSVLAQARTGPRLSQQSPHITVHDFDGGSTGPYQLNLDRWYLRYASGGLEVWTGRNQLSFWRQDDLFVFENVRWGDANQVRATNIRGSELRAVYTIRPGMNLFARLFLVDAIDLLEPVDTTRESGNRFRLDWNVSF